MDDYLPKQIYYDYAENSKYFNNIQKKYVLNLLNVARNLAICDMKKDLIIHKMNWYVSKIIDLVTKNQCNYNGYSVAFEALAYSPLPESYSEVKVEVVDCNGDIYRKSYQKDYREYIKEENYLQRDYSDKLYSYTCNLLELYNKYFNESNSEFIYIKVYMNGDKCFGGRGFIEWR